MNIRLILADDHQMMREGLRLVIERSRTIEVVGEAANGLETVELAVRLIPDVVVMNVDMPDLNGVDATRRIKAAHPVIQVIGLSAYADRRYVLGMFDAGAGGYLQKSAAGAELMQAIETVSRGRKYLGSDIANSVVDSYVNRVFPAGLSPLSQLGDREREVLQHLAEGATTKQIATSMQISSRTVETHRRNIMKKLDLHNVVELTKYAIREGLVRIEVRDRTPCSTAPLQ